MTTQQDQEREAFEPAAYIQHVRPAEGGHDSELIWPNEKDDELDGLYHYEPLYRRADLAQQAEPVRVPDGFARVPITLIDEACSSLDDYAAGAPWGSWDRKRRDDLRAILTAAQAAQPEPQRTLVSVSSIDIEKMIARCVPGGTSCDPQQVADDIRRYCNAWPDIEEPQRVGLSEELAAWRERFPQYIYRPQDDMVVLKLDGIKEPT